MDILLYFLQISVSYISEARQGVRGSCLSIQFVFFYWVVGKKDPSGKESVVLMCILFDKFNGTGTFFTEMRVYMRE